MAEKMVKATVAKWSVEGDDPVKKQTVATPDGKGTHEVPARKVYGPGQEVELPESEVMRLRALGYLVDPDAAVEPASTTPGARITEK